MSVANYGASCKEHSQILISVQSHGSISSAEFEEVLSKIRKYEQITVADAGRTINVRFEVNVPSKNSEWGFFQPHRRVMGLILIAGCSTAMDMALLHEIFQKKKENLSSFIFDARCFVFGTEHALIQRRKGEMLQFSDIKSWTSCNKDIEEFLTSVFYVLESKRLQILSDKSDKPPLLTAPFEKQQSSSYDSESRSYRKKCSGRWKKHLADISLLSGLTLDALQNYHSALDTLVSLNDQVWVGGALEGLCVTSALVWYFGDNEANCVSSTDPASTTKHALDPRNLVSSKLSSTGTTANLLKYCIQTPEDFVDRYKEAVINYSRCKHLGVIELESCIKATKVMAIMKKSMEASEFLQNAVYITLNVTDDERITRYSVVADLYGAIEFHRKSSFYKRVAAMQCVAPHLEKPNWQKCNKLLQQALNGYQLNVFGDEYEAADSNMLNSMKTGWPPVQLRVLHELVFSSRRLGLNVLAIRYMVHLLMHMHKFLSESEEKEICAGLEQFAGKPLMPEQSLPDAVPMCLINLPCILEVAPKPLPIGAQPTVITTEQNKDSVFLFTPSTYQTLKKVEQCIDFKWCVGTPAEVRMLVRNPLRCHSLHVSELKLICEAVDTDTTEVLECHQVSLDIPQDSAVEATVVVMPKIPGTVVITGYESWVYGIKSQCMFRDLDWIPLDQFEVEITPALPVLQREIISLPTVSEKKKEVLELNLYSEEIKKLHIPFTNTGKVAVDLLDVFLCQPLNSTKDAASSACTTMKKSKPQWLTVRCCNDEIQSKLPLLPGETIQIPVYMEAAEQTEKFDSQSCFTELRIKYSCKEAAEENWCRSLSVKLVVNLQPCLAVSELTVAAASRQMNCVTSMTIKNNCKDTIRITSFKLNSSNVIKPTLPGVFHAFSLPQIENGHLVLSDLDPNESVKLKLNIPTSSMDSSPAVDHKSLSLDSGQSKVEVLSSEDVIQNKLNETLSLEWRSGAGMELRKGKINISTCDLSVASFVNLVTAPVHWEFIVNGDNVTESQQYNVVVGEPYPVNITLKNVTELTISHLDVELEIYQDQENGFREWNMADSVICVGCQGQCFKEVAPGSSVDFKIILVFLLIGQYHVRLRRMAAHRASMVEKMEGELRRTLSNQSNPEVLSYREFSPKVVFTVGC